MTPFQAGKAGKAFVSRYPLTAGFNSKGSEISVGYTVCSGFYVLAQFGENGPMTLSRVDDKTVRAFPQILSDTQGVGNGQRCLEDARVCDDSQKST